MATKGCKNQESQPEPLPVTFLADPSSLCCNSLIFLALVSLETAVRFLGGLCGWLPHGIQVTIDKRSVDHRSKTDFRERKTEFRESYTQPSKSVFLPSLMTQYLTVYLFMLVLFHSACWYVAGSFNLVAF